MWRNAEKPVEGPSDCEPNAADSRGHAVYRCNPLEPPPRGLLGYGWLTASRRGKDARVPSRAISIFATCGTYPCQEGIARDKTTIPMAAAAAAATTTTMATAAAAELPWAATRRNAGRRRRR
eukprot:836835-Pyramimonas_sp.AAC.1